MHIGICGYAESGKDEVADVLVDEFNFIKIGMSDALDRYLLILDPWIDMPLGHCLRYSNLRETMTYVEAKTIPEVRRLLQLLGTDVGRAIDPDMWVKELDKSARDHERVVTTGIRFQNEAEMVDVLIWVDRKGVGPKNGHVSEELEHIFEMANFKIFNYDDLNSLKKATKDLYKNGICAPPLRINWEARTPFAVKT